MRRIIILGKDPEKLNKLSTVLSREGYYCSISNPDGKNLEDLIDQSISLALVDLNSSTDAIQTSSMYKQIHEIKIEKKLPVLGIVSINTVQCIESQNYVDDFIVAPYDDAELIIRVKRMINKRLNTSGGEIIACGDLTIDIAKCEVYLENRIISLTFTEYELLKFLAKNKGRAFTRDALLNEVWGYDYYGGDRTVDVHIKRLRNKIEDQDHIFIETIRNIGYKFKEASACNKNLTCL